MEVLGQLDGSLFAERVDDGAAEVLGRTCTSLVLEEVDVCGKVEVGENVLGQLDRSLFVKRVDDGAVEALRSSCTGRILVVGRKGKGCSRRGSGPGARLHDVDRVCYGLVVADEARRWPGRGEGAGAARSTRLVRVYVLVGDSACRLPRCPRARSLRRSAACIENSACFESPLGGCD